MWHEEKKLAMTQPDSPASRKAPAKTVPLTAAGLRLQAEKRLRDKVLPGGSAPLSAIDVQRLLHELQVHQIELEMQAEELKESRDTAEEAAARYTDLYDFAPVGYLTVNQRGAITQANLAAAQLLGVGRAQLAGKRLTAWAAEAALPGFNNFLRQVFASGAQSGHDLALSVKDRTIDVQIDASVNDDGQQCRLVLIDISATKAHEEELEHIAHYDTLTGLPNRHLLSDRMLQAIVHSQRHSQCLAVLYLDLDNIKAINDKHGHAVGDALLIKVASRMKAALREGDTLARMGGDEFVAVLVELDQTQDSLPVVERLLQAASTAIAISPDKQKSGAIRDLLLKVTASIGVTFYPQDHVDADQLMRHADQAMYAAKQAGKNRYHLFDVANDAAIQSRHDDLKRFRQALDANEFVLHYQPEVNMRTGKVTGVEALIRWQHPERGLLAPGIFLPLVQGHSLCIEIGEWVIKTALAQISAWKAQGLKLRVSVNIATQHLQHDGFAGQLAGLFLCQSDVLPQNLHLEVLESSAMEDIDKVSAAMQSCLALGVDFSLDDFGTGYSSLTHLRRLPAHTLKIDQSFVKDMLLDADDLAIVKGVIGLAHAFGREVVAEGVEARVDGDALLALGCELAQGYAIARPMPASAIPPWVKKWQAKAVWTA